MWWIVMLASAYVLTGAFAVRFRRAHRRVRDAPVTPRPREEELTLCEVAFLGGYERQVAKTALAAMLLAGRLTARDKVLTVVDAVPRDEVEADVIRVIGLAPRRKSWKRMGRLRESPGIAAVGDRLADQGLVGGPTLYRAAESARGILIGVLILSCAMGAVAIGLAVPEDGSVLIPIAATLLLWAAGVIAMAPKESLSEWTTEAGRAALAAHNARHQPWIPRTHDDLPEKDAVLLGDVARRGSLSGKLAPLDEATAWPASPHPTTPNNDPPGLGGL